MKTIGRQEQIDSIVERDPIASANLRALSEHNRTYITTTTVGGKVRIPAVDPVIYQNVRDTIVRLALRRFYKPSNR